MDEYLAAARFMRGVFASGRTADAALEDVLWACAYVDHVVLTYDEASVAIRVLTATGLMVESTPLTFQLTDTGRGLLDAQLRADIVSMAEHPSVDIEALSGSGAVARLVASAPQVWPHRAPLGRAEYDAALAGVHAKHAARMTTSSDLRYLDFTRIAVGDRTYEAINLTRFHLASSVDNQTALASLLAHPRYRHDYASPMPDTDADFVTTEVHGPYPLDSIDRGRFHQTTADDATIRLRDWAADYDDDPSSYAALDKHLSSLVETGTTIYLLDDFRDGGEHDFGWILGAFLELVVIDRPRNTLTLLVATSD